VDDLAANLSDEAVLVLNELSSSQGALETPNRIIDDCLAVLKRRDLGDKIALLDGQIPLASGAEKDQLVVKKTKLQEQMRSLGGPQSWKLFAPKSP
jgi:hypothetical protein